MLIRVDDICCTILGLNDGDSEKWPELYKLLTYEIPNAERVYAVQLKKLCMELMNQQLYSKQQLKDQVKYLIKSNRWAEELWEWYLRKPIEAMVEESFAVNIRKTLSSIAHAKGSDSQTSLINTQNGYTFPTGLLPTVVDFAKKHGIQIAWSDQRHYNTNISSFTQSFKNISLRPYQKAAILTAINNKLDSLLWQRGIFQIPTGGGKTELAIALAMMHSGRTVFLVNRKELLHQTHERFSKAFHPDPVGMIGGGIQNVPEGSKVVIASVQTIWSYLRKKNKDGWYPVDELQRTATQVIIDEAHGLAAGQGQGPMNTMVSVANYFVYASCRWALTATPLMRDDLSNALLKGVTGEVVFEISNQQLIEKGYLTKPRIIFNRVNHRDAYEDPITKEELKKPPGTQWTNLYDFAIVRSPQRNKVIADILQTVPTPAIVLVQRLDHVQYINHFLPQKMLFLSGKASKEEREQAKRMLREGFVKILCATTIFDEGVDIPELRAIVLAGGGKSNIKALQRLGRGLRLAKDKDEVIIHDFTDFNETSPGWIPMKHSRERMNLFKEEGFDVTVNK